MKLFHDRNYSTQDFSCGKPHPIIENAATTLCERLKWFKRPFEKTLILGPYGEFLQKKFSFLKNTAVEFKENSRNYDCIISFFDLQTVNDVPSYLSTIKKRLQPGGFFTAVFMGGESFLNLKNTLMKLELHNKGDVSLRVHPTIHISDAAALMQNSGFACPMADIEKHTHAYDNLYAFIQELRLQSATSHLYETPKIMPRACANSIINDKNPFEEKFDLIYMTGLQPTPGNKIISTHPKPPINLIK